MTVAMLPVVMVMLVLKVTPLAVGVLLGTVVELFRREEALGEGEAFERGEEALVVGGGVGAGVGFGDAADELVAEVAPGVEAVIVEGDGEAEDAAFPLGVEDELTVLARQGFVA